MNLNVKSSEEVSEF